MIAVTRDEAATLLVELKDRRAALAEERRAVSKDSRELVRAARAAGMSYAEIMALSGLSKQGVSDFLRDK